MIQVGIIEDNIFLLKSFRDYLNNTEGITVSFSCSSMEEMRQHAAKNEKTTPEIILLDILLPGESGMDGIPFLKQTYPNAKIIMLTAYNDESLIINCIKLGAVGYALKNSQASQLVEIIKQTSRSGSFIDENSLSKIINSLQTKTEVGFLEILTYREKEIVALVERGLSYKQMSTQLFVTTYTINYHLKNIYKKLGIHSKSELLTKIIGESK
jgi:DNA-binding NarL/FixJ family response regulator